MRRVTCTAVVVLLLAASGCSSELGRIPTAPGPGPPASLPEEQRVVLEDAARATDAVVRLARQAIVIPFPGGSITLGYQNGFYVVEVVMFGSERRLRVQFQDASGRPMQGYDPQRTRAIRIITTNEDRSGLRHFDLLVRGVEAGASEFRVDGNGRFGDRELVWEFYANNLVLAKVGNPYPLRGTAALETEHASGSRTSVELRFGGSRVVDGTLRSGSVSVFFTLDLVSLEVTPREPEP